MYYIVPVGLLTTVNLAKGLTVRPEADEKITGLPETLNDVLHGGRDGSGTRATAEDVRTGLRQPVHERLRVVNTELQKVDKVAASYL